MLKRAAATLADATARGAIPGAVLHVAVAGEAIHESAHGVTRYDDPQPVTPATWFDLASLTKILATTPLMMTLVARGALSLETRLGDVLTDLAPHLSEQPIERFLNHTSGLPAWRPYHLDVPASARATAAGKAFVAARARHESLEYEPGTRQVYSDIGMTLAGLAVETAGGGTLDALFHQWLAAPLDLAEIEFLQARPRTGIEIAATERCPWRGRVLCGEVHDENTWAAGGALGPSGLMGTARAVARLMEELRAAGQGGGRLFSTAVFDRFQRKPQLPGASYRVGFDSVSAGRSTTGRHFGPATFGHLGFTGTSAWCDPARALTVVMLTNRVHPDRANDALVSLRPRVHDQIVEEWFDVEG